MYSLPPSHQPRNNNTTLSMRRSVYVRFLPFLGYRDLKVASMSRSDDAASLSARYEHEDEELFETSSSISASDSEGEDRFSDGEGDDALDDRFTQQQQQQQPVRRLNSDTSLYDLSPMMAQLPVKKGLSKYYDGKSQSFACMSEVRCLDDLRKKVTPFKKIKPSNKSYAALDGGDQQGCRVPSSNGRATGSSCANLMARSNGENMLYKPPPIPVNRSGYHQ